MTQQPDHESRLSLPPVEEIAHQLDGSDRRDS